AGADQVEHEQIALAGIRPSAASDHLAVQRPRTRRAGDDDGLDAWLVEAFPEELAVSEHLRLAAGETLEDGAALAEVVAAVDRLRGDAARAEGRSGLVGDGDAGHEDQAATLLGVGAVRPRDLLRRADLVEDALDLAGHDVACAHVELAEVGAFQGDA